MLNLADVVSLSYYARSLTFRKLLRHGADGLVPLRRKACWGFLLSLKIHPSAGLEPTNLGSAGKHANHLHNRGLDPLSSALC
jgi:hypothetical protein